MSGVTSYNILQKTEDYQSFTTNSVESSLRHEKELSRAFRKNKPLECFGLRPSPLASKTKTTQMEKRKLCITLELLNELSTEFLETKCFIDEHLEQKCLKEKISIEEVIYFYLKNLEAKN